MAPDDRGLQALFVDLKNRSMPVRLRAAQEIKNTIYTAYRELTADKFADFYHVVGVRLSSMIVGSTDNADKLGGIYLIEELIDFPGDDTAQRTTRFAGYLRAALRGLDPEVLLNAARALGKLAKPGGALAAELVDSEIKNALEWLQIERQEARRFAAVLIISELAKNSPTLVFGYVPQILESIWTAIRDPKILIREKAAEAVGACFQLFSQRGLQTQYYNNIWKECLAGFKNTSMEFQHGSLLIVRELLKHGALFMHDHYREACEVALALKTHREPNLRAEVVELIPALARYSNEEFCALYLQKFMVFLSSQLKKDKERSAAFKAIGGIAGAIRNSISPYLEAIITAIKYGLELKAKSKDKDGAIFECLSELAKATGQTLCKYIEDPLLDVMLGCGLSQELCDALSDMATHIAPVKPQIQAKLLDAISLVLQKKPFKPLGCPENRTPPMPIFAKEWQQHGLLHGEVEIALALKTLGNFEFRTFHLNEFVKDVVIPYLKSLNPEIRKAAAMTSTRLYVQETVVQQVSLHSLQVVRAVVAELLDTAISDPVLEIRRLIMQNLHSKFDGHLAEQENIRKVVIAINESDYELRSAAVVIIGRLTAKNPAYVFPPLRKLLANFTQAITSSDDPMQEEEGARMVSLLVKNASSLVRPFVDGLVNVLVPKATSLNPSVSATCLKAIGDLAAIGGLRLEKYLPRLMPTILDCLQDLGSISKREAALLTLGQIASNTGYVIAPYLDYPDLLGILTNIIKTEHQGPIRMETIKLLGILGALDPYRYQQSVEQNSSQRAAEAQIETDVTILMQCKNTTQEDFYPKVVMNVLMNSVLKDSSLAQYHTMVIDAVVAIFKTMGQKCVEFLPQIIPIFVVVIQTSPLNRLEPYFNQLAILSSIVGIHIRPYVDDLVGLILHNWEISPGVQITCLALIEALSRGLGNEFYPSMVKLLPHLMRVVDLDSPIKSNPSNRVLHTILVFGNQAERSMWLVIPKLVQVFTNLNKSTAIRKACIETIGTIARQTNVSDYAGQLLYNLRDTLASHNDKIIRTAAYDCIVTFLFQYPRESEPFLDGLRMAVVASGLPHTSFDNLRTKIRNREALPQDLRPTIDYQNTAEDIVPVDGGNRKLPVNQEHLRKAWTASKTSTKEDWQEWMRRFSIELLKESPSNALRACQQLATIYPQLARDLFNVAFISCWSDLFDSFQEQLLGALEMALTSTECPPEVWQTLLNLAEFMEHDDKPLPIDIGQLGGYAGKCHLYAKALHWKELEFEEEKSPSVVEALISINNQLQQTDAAVGILRNAQKYSDFQLRETWFEKLGRWDDAFQAYDERAKTDNSFEVVMGKMRCLHALGDWEQLQNITEQRWNLAGFSDKRAIAPLAAAAAWGMRAWESMDNYLSVMKDNSPDRFFFKAIRAVNQDFFAEAQSCIDRARDGLDTELSALLGESYTRAYDVIVRVQMLAELEEIISYKKAYNDPEKQALMRETWRTRLEGCEGKVETWQRMLKVRQLVLDPKDSKEVWIKYGNLCRKSGRIGLAKQAINALKITTDSSDHLVADPDDAPEVCYALHKYNWASGDKVRAMEELRDFTNVLADQCNELSLSVAQLENTVISQMNVTHRLYPADIRAKKQQIANTKNLLSKCFLRLGQWLTQSKTGRWTSEDTHEILLAYNSAAQYNPEGYKAHHAWALANFEVVNAIAPANDLSSNVLFPPAAVTEHVVPAVQGFFKSIALSPAGSTLQDTLRLLTLWFRHGSHPEVDRALVEGFPTVSMDTWLEVIPQLIARINQPNAKVRVSVQKLLFDVGKVHPQALVYPLSVAMKSEVKGRSDAAKAVMERLRTVKPVLVDQAQLVSKELIRVAVLWHELWHEALEEASRLYFGNNDAEGMMQVLEPLHKQLEEGSQTLREQSFVQTFGRELNEAKHWCEEYQNSKEQSDLNQAWDLYYNVFKRITKQLGQLMTLDLTYVSPDLKEAVDLELAVPGTYQVGKPITRITKFDSIFTVFASKQRPRKMSMYGSDGVQYTFLLKGHEDIRQDERVMQLFGLVNTLLSKDADSFKRHLNIIRFPAIPLSQSSGLLGWIKDSDPLHTLIKDYREQRSILLNIEHRIMLQMAPQYDNLTLMQKVEVFSYAMDNTTGKDLHRVLWLRSPNSEAWLERRTNYTRSLAVMSMVGYILGLGDRHPSNIMLLRKTGKIAHIDYGDCFEVAMHREKYPERVPFRLTRMLTYAMEVSNIDGSYKISCEAVMRVLRENKDSLMAVLEAFIHDPLINWRLTSKDVPEPSFRSARRESIMGPEHPQLHNRDHTGSFMDHMNMENARSAGPVIGSGHSIRARGRTSALSALHNNQPNQEERELQNERALQVLKRVREKLTGNDFNTKDSLDIEEQVARLIAQATSIENICQHYIGWCSFW